MKTLLIIGLFLITSGLSKSERFIPFPKKITKKLVEVVYNTNFELARYIKEHEGLVLHPYKCPGGYLTIGYGHLINKNEQVLNKTITKNQADSLLLSDIKKYTSYVKRVTKLTGKQLMAISHLAYAIGPGNAAEVINDINTGINPESNMLKWCNIKGKPNENLLKQRKQEIEWYNENKQHLDSSNPE